MRVPSPYAAAAIVTAAPAAAAAFFSPQQQQQPPHNVVSAAAFSTLSSTATYESSSSLAYSGWAAGQSGRRCLSLAPLQLPSSSTALQRALSSSSDDGGWHDGGGGDDAGGGDKRQPSRLNEKKRGGTSAGGGGGARRRRRFLQDAHPAAAVVATTTTTAAAAAPPSSPFSATSSAEDAGEATHGKGANGGGNRRLRRAAAAAAASAPTSNRSGSRRSNPMLQRSKSIEELESIMSKRWGTNADAFRADPTEYEVATTDDNYLDDDHDGDGGGPSAASAAAARKKGFRGKPVLDPWQKEERLQLQKEAEERRMRRRNKEKTPADLAGSGAFRRRTGDDDGRGEGERSVLDRVRRNQARVRRRREEILRESGADGRREKKGAKKEGTKKGEGRPNGPYPDDEEGTFTWPGDVTRDYYDEDDEGYEPGDREYGSLISPRPAGGSGSSSSSSSSSVGAGFIFSPEAASRTERGAGGRRGAPSNRGEGEKEEEQRQPEDGDRRAPRRIKAPIPSAILDEHGNETYLTLEQARKNLRTLLAAEGNADLDGDDDGFDDMGANEDDDGPHLPRSLQRHGRIATTWEDLGITHPTVLSNLQSSKMRCHDPLPVQDRACPPALTGNDVLVSTHTGSGKTLAFLVPLAQRLLFDDGRGGGGGVRVLVVAPGRELASQIVSVARDLFDGTGLSAALAIGGTPFGRNVDNIRKKKPDIVVGTPGRIAELVVGRPGEKTGRLKISSLQSLVLDEFDALLEYKPHREPTAAIARAVKRRHGDSLQTILCSATASDMMGGSRLDEYLRPGYAHATVEDDDILITADGGAGRTTTRVSRTAIHGAVHVPHRRFALETLRKVLHTEPTPQQVLIFVDNSRRVGIVIDKLAEMGIIAAPLHGGAGSEKGDRAEVSKALREGYVGIVVATEMAARGIDAPLLTHVINLDLPTDASHYAHRAGRCGRGGRPGVVINFTSSPQERGVPQRFAESLGITMHSVEARGGKLRIIQDQLPEDGSQ